MTKAQGQQHGLKGLLGAMRAQGYRSSTYADGDMSGQAGHLGMPHGMADGESGGRMGDDKGEGLIPVSLGGKGWQEGGVRAGGVSEPETLPASYTQPKKRGYDEHRRPATTVHGVAGVEGVTGDGSMDAGSGMTTAPKRMGMGATVGDMGHGAGGNCPHGCGYTMKSAHGMARHVKARHGGFGGLGHAFRDKLGHGDVGGKDIIGETEGPAQWEAIRAQFAEAKAKIGKPPVPDTGNSYLVKRINKETGTWA